MNLPIDYIIQENIGIKECISMNINQQNWDSLDYIKSYSEKGIESYKYLNSLMECFNIKNTSILCVALFGASRFNAEKIKTGKIKITQEQYFQAKNRLNYFIKIYEDYKDLSRINLLLQGLLFCCYINNVNIFKLREKVLSVLENKKIPPIPTMNDVMQFLEEVYNRNSNHSNYVYIYTEYRKQNYERIIHRK